MREKNSNNWRNFLIFSLCPFLPFSLFYLSTPTSHFKHLFRNFPLPFSHSSLPPSHFTLFLYTSPASFYSASPSPPPFEVFSPSFNFLNKDQWPPPQHARGQCNSLVCSWMKLNLQSNLKCQEFLFKIRKKDFAISLLCTCCFDWEAKL